MDFNATTFFAFLMGTLPFAHPAPPRLDTAQYLIALLLGLLAALGFCRACFSRTAALLFWSMAAFFALLSYFALGVDDPWTGQVGHRWNVFKLCKYAYPLIVALQVLGAWMLCREGRLRQGLLVAVVAVIALVHGPFHYKAGDRDSDSFISRIGSTTPLRDLRRLRRLVERERPEQIVLCSTDALRSSFLAYAVYPRPLGNAWDPSWRSWMIHPPAVDALGSGSCLLLIDVPDALTRSTVWKPVWLDRQSLQVLRFVSPHGSEVWNGEPACWVGNDPVQLDLFDPTGGPAQLAFRAVIGPSLPNTAVRTLRVTEPDGRESDHVVTLSADWVRLPVRLVKGLNRVQLRCLDPRDETAAQGDPRSLLLGMVHPIVARPATSSVARRE